MLRRREEAAREAEAAAQMQPGTEEWPPPEESWDVPEEEVPAPPASDDSVEAPLADASFDEEPAAPVSAAPVTLGRQQTRTPQGRALRPL